MNEEPLPCPRCEYASPILSGGPTDNSMSAHCLWCDFGVILKSNLPIPPERYVDEWNSYVRRARDEPKVIAEGDRVKVKMQRRKDGTTTYFLILPRGQISALTEDEFRETVRMIRRIPGEEYE